MRAVVRKSARAAKGRRAHQGFHLRQRVRGAHRGAEELVHRAGIVATMPADVPRVSETRGSAQIAQENCAFLLGEARDLVEKAVWFGEMMQYGIAHHEIESRVRKREAIAVGDRKLDAPRKI